MSAAGRIGDVGHGLGPGSENTERRLEDAAAQRGAPEALLRTLADVVEERRMKVRDCRDCKNFERDASGLNFGWCGAHEQHVKLYHPAGNWYSQCLFKGLRRFKPQEFERERIKAQEAAAAPGRELPVLPPVIPASIIPAPIMEGASS